MRWTARPAPRSDRPDLNRIRRARGRAQLAALLVLLVAVVAASPAAASKKKKKKQNEARIAALTEKHRTWLYSVDPLINEEELEVFLDLPQ
ncbi:MAG: hypothetical protein AAF772_05970, partial [Acidobacteriota bacterium]